MTINYTSLLKLAKPVTGTESGTWGDTVNDAITSPLDVAVAGAVSIDVTSGNVTLSNNDGSGSNQARYAILLVIGTPGVSRNIIGPGTSKIYLVKNSSNGEIVVKASATTGVTIPVNTEASVFWNGSDYEIVGMQGPSSSTDNAVVRFDGTTGKVVQNSVVTIADTTGDVAGVGALTASGNVTLSGGTANGVLYLNGSKVATSGSALTFDGTDLATTGSFSTGNAQNISLNASSSGQTNRLQWKYQGTAYAWIERVNSNGDMAFGVQSSEQMRLTSTGLGIGTSSPGARIDARISTSSTTAVTDVAYFYANSTGTATSSFGARLSLYTENANGNEYPASIAAVNDAGGSGLTNLAFYTYNGSLTERMRLDSSGNLGLGVTPSGWTGGVLCLGGDTAISFQGQNGDITANAYYNAGWKYTTTGFASHYYQNAGSHSWYTAPSGTAGNAITFTQAMTLGSDGLFQVGTTTGAVNDGKLQVSATGTGAGTANTVVGLNVFEETSGNKAGLWFGAMTNSNVGVIGSRTASGSIAFQTYSGSWGERARITSGGYFKASNTGTYIGASDLVHELVTNNDGNAIVVLESTSASYVSTAAVFIGAATNTTNNTFYAIGYYNRGAAAYKFRVADSGNVTNTNNSYAGISEKASYESQ